MIEIEEEYKLLEWIKHLQDEYASGAWNKDDDVKFKQILQDHEDALDLKALGGTQSVVDAYLELEKDRQIVKRLEEGLSQWKMNGSIPAWIVYELRKILDGKK